MSALPFTPRSRADVSSAAPSSAPAGLLRWALVDVAAYRANLRHLRETVAPAELMAIVKADAYGHGATTLVAAAVDEGVRWFGTLDLVNAHELRAAGVGDGVNLFAWQFGPHETFERAVSEQIDLGLSSLAQLETVARAVTAVAEALAPDAAVAAPVVARVHLNIDTGLHRDGALPADWAALVARAVDLVAEGRIVLRGVYSHLAESSDDEDTDSAALLTASIEQAVALGARFELRHLTASSAGLERPELRLDMVRMGSNTYGIPVTEGVSAADRGLTPVMTVGARVARVKRIAAGTGVSYDYTYRAPRETTVALVPIGYADGISRRAQHGVAVALRGKRYPIVGRVAMDQFLIDVGDDPVEVGDEVTLFGTGAAGELTVGEWADLIGTIGEEVTCSIGPRVTRVYR